MDIHDALAIAALALAAQALRTLGRVVTVRAGRPLEEKTANSPREREQLTHD